MTPTNSRWVRPGTLHLARDVLLMEACAGKLAKSTILSGFSALKELSEVISQPDSIGTRGFSSFRAACEVLTSRYYSWVFVMPFRENL
jgi:hypothetical protein